MVSINVFIGTGPVFLRDLGLEFRIWMDLGLRVLLG